MSDIKFSDEEKQQLVEKLRDYFTMELEQELGHFEAEFLLDFLSRELGPYYYNQGLYDAQAVMQSRVDAVIEAIYEIEKST